MKRMILIMVGALLGLILGYFISPDIPLIEGKVPFEYAITNGQACEGQGLDELLIPAAQQAFQYMVIGAILGALVGLGISIMITSGNTNQPNRVRVCQQCNAVYDVSVKFCDQCGIALGPQILIEGSKPKPDVPKEAYAGLGRRIVAGIIDNILLSILGLLLFDSWTTTTIIAWVILSMLYFGIMEVKWRASLGKMAMGIVVISADNRYPNVEQILLRTVFRLVDGLLSYLVAITTIALNEKSQRIGDMVAGTLVVKKQYAISLTEQPSLTQ